jgi:hypothetical protein
VRNTAIRVVVAPTVVMILGLLFAGLTERIRRDLVRNAGPRAVLRFCRGVIAIGSETWRTSTGRS